MDSKSYDPVPGHQVFSRLILCLLDRAGVLIDFGLPDEFVADALKKCGERGAAGSPFGTASAVRR